MKKPEFHQLIREEVKNVLKETGNIWYGTVSDKDDFGDKIVDTFIDSRVAGGGSWALMTPRSWKKYGMSKKLGTGYGQMYKKGENGKWVKIKG